MDKLFQTMRNRVTDDTEQISKIIMDRDFKRTIYWEAIEHDKKVAENMYKTSVDTEKRRQKGIF
ncbi:hypothetical protein TSAR_008669 [Trichomalopsis sarcophagae]|uniref:Uncharacterized protein n=1 Tax=Trichomalopsis sarcophagae TaxID=543379 RepID=A0A232F1J0_9HYME|nr:hypothetical protein TSAR_008669 [Trichomalopsis sarcophagae]